VDHQAGGGAGVGARGDELELAAAAFLGGGAEQADAARPARVGLEGGGGAEEGGQRGRGDQVVPAGVADAREGVVLGVEDDQVAAGAEVGGEGGREPVGVGGDGEAEGLEG